MHLRVFQMFDCPRSVLTLYVKYPKYSELIATMVEKYKTFKYLVKKKNTAYIIYGYIATNMFYFDLKKLFQNRS